MLDLRFAFLPAALLALGCTETVESTDIRTSGIYPEIEVVGNASGSSKVTVRLKTGGDDSNTFLDLKGEDELKVTVGDETKTMDQSGNDYIASFSTNEGGTEFTVAFLRGDDDDSAPASVVSLPEPFDMTIDTTKASRETDDVPYSWDPAGDGDMDWHLDGDCIQLESGSTPDDGMNAIAAGKIGTFDSDKDKSCTAKLELSRAQGGTIDPAFTEGGSIVAKQVRADSFESVP